MPRYHFHLQECGTVIDDEEGRDLAGLASVRAEAIRAARDVMSAEVQRGQLCLGCCIEVRDADGLVVLTLPFRETLTVSGL